MAILCSAKAANRSGLTQALGQHEESTLISIKTGGMDVLDSKSFLALGLGETTISLQHNAEHLNFVLDFRNAPDDEQGLAYELIDPLSLRIILTNWNGPFATSLIDPENVGSIGGRELFLMFSVQKTGDKSDVRHVTFTAYLGAEVANGHA